MNSFSVVFFLPLIFLLLRYLSAVSDSFYISVLPNCHATLVRELGCHVGIHFKVFLGFGFHVRIKFKRVRFELHMLV